jgi:hypothetical protein
MAGVADLFVLWRGHDPMVRRIVCQPVNARLRSRDEQVAMLTTWNYGPWWPELQPFVVVSPAQHAALTVGTSHAKDTWNT